MSKSDLERGELDWQEALKLLTTTVKAFAREAQPRFEGGQVVLVFSGKHAFFYQGAQKHLDEIRAATQRVLGANVVLELED
jgi:DNA polymerase-3 subunit gamma/tau